MELRVHLDEIKEAGLSLTPTLSVPAIDDALRADPATGYRARAASQLEVKFERLDERQVLARGSLLLPLESECSRCLRPVSMELPVAFELVFVQRDGREEPAAPVGEDDGVAHVAGSFAAAEADQIAFTGRELELGPALAEQILLALPMAPLCVENCQGLCTVCGQNLNDGACGCDRSVPDPRWAKLRSIKLS